MAKGTPIRICLSFILFLACGLMGNSQSIQLKFDQLTVDDGLPQNAVYSMTKDKYGYMWFGTWGGAVRYDGYNVQVFRANEKDSTALSDNRISGIITDSLHTIWVEVEPRNLVFKYDYQTETFTRFNRENAPKEVLDKLKNRYGYTVKRASNEEYQWISSTSGLIQVNTAQKDTLIYHADAQDPLTLSDNLIKDVYLDENGHLWVGTQSGGVDHADLFHKAFRNFFKGRFGEGLLDNVVRASCFDQLGRLWVGSENQGITIITNSNTSPTYTYIGAGELPDLRIRALFSDSKGRMWIGTKMGLFYYSPTRKGLTHCTMDMCHPSIFAISEDHDGQIWVGTFNGLAKYDAEKDQFTCFNPDSGLAGRQIMDILVDQKNRLWVATEEGGISCAVLPGDSADSLRFTNFTQKSTSGNKLLSNRTYSLTEDNLGQIWVATEVGLSSIHPETHDVRHWTKDDGLADDFIMAVIFDGKNSVWASHTKGLSRINVETGHVQNFNRKDGLQGNEFKQSAAYRSPSTDQLYFGGSNGLTTFLPSQIQTNPHPPRMVLTHLRVMHQEMRLGTKINNREILHKSLLTTDEITLTWWDKTFQVEFAAIHFTNPQNNKYKYRLKGYDKAWIHTDASRRMASYSNLAAGDYTFEVHGANSDGVWSDVPATLEIHVLGPWWTSWWAIGVYLAVISALIWLIYRYLDSRIQMRKKEAIHRAKLQFFTEISHEFRTPLTLIIDPLERLINENPKKPMAAHYYQLMRFSAQQLLMLVNQLLDFRKLEAGKLTLERVELDFVAFVKRMAASFEATAQHKQVSLTVHSELDAYLLYVDEDKMTMVMNNLLSNALKFTPTEGNITLSVYAAPTREGIFIEVQDSGIGIPAEDLEKIFGIFYQSASHGSQVKGSGIGLALTKELVELHGGKITVKSTIGEGTDFKIYLPHSTPASGAGPLQQASQKQAEPIPFFLDTEANRGAKTSSSLILVVDDNTAIRQYIALHFSPHYTVITAPNGRDGVQKAIQEVPDLIISDIMMPDMDGLQLCKKLKSDERTSHIPIILLTARSSDEAKTKGYGLGADSYVTKPFSTQVLLARVKNLLEQRQLLQAKFGKENGFGLQELSSNPVDQQFLEKARTYIENNLESGELDVDTLARELNMSRSQLYRKIKGLTDKSTADFVTAIRMKKASELLLSGRYNISETAFKVGYHVPNNFTRAFIKHFGLSPSEYIKKNGRR